MNRHERISRRGPAAAAVAAAVLLLVAAGCATSRDRAVFRAEPSFLDYLVFSYHPGLAETNRAPLLTRIELAGTGHLQLARGRSRRVTESFWQGDAGNPDWHDMEADQVVLDADAVKRYVQRAVDARLFDRRQRGRRVANEGGPYVLVHGRVGEHKGFLVTDDPAFMQLFGELQALFR